MVASCDASVDDSGGERSDGSAPYSGRMEDTEAEAVTDLRALIETAEQTVHQIQDAVRAYGVVLEMLEHGSSVRDSLAAGDVSEVRQAVTMAITELEIARKKSRVSLMRADVADGASLKSVSGTWGVSRQLVHRYLQDEAD